MEDVERSGGIRVPGTAWGGAHTVNGVINFITKSVKDGHGPWPAAQQRDGAVF